MPQRRSTASPPSTATRPWRLGARTRVARRVVLSVARLSRLLGLGAGSIIGGRAGLAVAPRLLEDLGVGRRVALITGTNGKTTTTRLLTEALGGVDRVATSIAGANMAAGIVTALAAAPAGAPAVLEVDEGYLASVAKALSPEVIVLLNLSRDQLDRVGEVRMVAQRWRAALAETSATVVANADDPLVVFAAVVAPKVEWVAAGGLWRLDAFNCPLCGGRIEFVPGSWHCACGFLRPAVYAESTIDGVRFADGRHVGLGEILPGRFNAANAAMALVAAELFGADVRRAADSFGAVHEVEGRFASVDVAGVEVRLLLAKNPAGWAELLGLVALDHGPVVVAINARDADGHDPSWLWDVPFEQLAGRRVVASGERRRDLAVRLRHAGVDYELGPARPIDAVTECAHLEPATVSAPAICVDFIGNYTAFQELRRDLRIGERSVRRPDPAHDARNAADTVRTSAPSPIRSPAGGTRQSALRVVIVHPDLLGTYGDTGNGVVLANRARWRGIDTELIYASSDEALPASGDVYLLGGGEDGPQTHAADRLADGALNRAVTSGAAVLAVCAGYQIIGESFPTSSGAVHAGVALLDVTTVRGTERRAVGEIVIEAAEGPWPLALGQLSGFENHAGRTVIGKTAKAFGRVLTGVGNGVTATDGAYHGRVFGTYLHGPVLARNPRLADLLIMIATGRPLPPITDAAEEDLREERFRSAGSNATPRLAEVMRRATTWNDNWSTGLRWCAPHGNVVRT